jgi:catechol 2,3-dioxygenase-like lactoylglutathione lyase family enzyme
VIMIEPKSSFPVFTVVDLDAARTFYTEHFGFEVVFAGEWYIHLVSKQGVQIGFLLPDQPTQPEIFHKPYSGDGVIFSLEVEDAEVAFTEAKSRSLNVALELRTEDWGSGTSALKIRTGFTLILSSRSSPRQSI